MKFNLILVFIFFILTFSTETYFLELDTTNKHFFITLSLLTQSLYSWFYSILQMFSTPLVFKSLTIDALSFTFKFVITIALLVFIRGGVPRYRYDFLTKIGWIKFLSLVLLIFLSSLLLVYLF